jgi:hypothetical protein
MNNDNTILNRFTNRQSSNNLGKAIEMFTSDENDEELTSYRNASKRLPDESVIEWEARLREEDKRATQANLSPNRRGSVDASNRKAAFAMQDEFLRGSNVDDSESESLFREAMVGGIKIDSNIWK